MSTSWAVISAWRRGCKPPRIGTGCALSDVRHPPRLCLRRHAKAGCKGRWVGRSYRWPRWLSLLGAPCSASGHERRVKPNPRGSIAAVEAGFCTRVGSPRPGIGLVHAAAGPQLPRVPRRPGNPQVAGVPLCAAAPERDARHTRAAFLAARRLLARKKAQDCASASAILGLPDKRSAA